MNKSELTELVAQETGLPKKQVRATLDAAFEEIAKGLAAGQTVTLRALGTLKVETRDASTRPRRKRSRARQSRVRFRAATRLERATGSLPGDAQVGYSGDPDTEF